MTLNLIETLKTSIYNPKKPKSTKIHLKSYRKRKKTKSHIFTKRSSTNQRWMLILMALFLRADTTHGQGNGPIRISKEASHGIRTVSLLCSI